jgi:hypothetical protein
MTMSSTFNDTSERNSFLDELDPFDVTEELKNSSSDLFAIFNLKIKRAVYGNYVYTLHHERYDL